MLRTTGLAAALCLLIPGCPNPQIEFVTETTGSDTGECLPQCPGECGDDGCGGTCGDCDDGLACTEDVCLQGSCDTEMLPETCAIEGTCMAGGVSDTTAPCQACMPQVSASAWSSRPDGAPCGTDGGHCVGGECCVADCQGVECGSDGCGGSCGQCEDGIPCTKDSCVSGVCTADTDPKFCVIGVECHPQATFDPSDPCQMCAPSVSQTAWSSAPDGKPCGSEAEVCYQGSCCDPAPGCLGAMCGPSDCGGSCGTCQWPTTCEGNLCF